MSKTLAIGFWCLKNHTQLRGQQKVVNLTRKCRILARAFGAIIRASLITFHFIPDKFGANNRVV